MNKKNVILHIGVEKTGSTSLQSYLSQYKDILLNEGVLYPETGMVSNHHYLVAKNEVDLSILIEEFELSGVNTLLLSSEHFSTIEDSRVIWNLKKAFSNYNVKIICYIRDPVTWLISLYGEHIKWGGGVSIERFYNKSSTKFDLISLVSRWKAVFGANNVNIFDYGSIADVVGHFLINFIEGHTRLPIKGDNNKSDSKIFLEVVRRINAIYPGVDTREVLRILRKRNQGLISDFSWDLSDDLFESLVNKQNNFNGYCEGNFFSKAISANTPSDDDFESEIAHLFVQLLGS